MSTERDRRPTLDIVAKAVGVSRATVSNAYNRPDQLSAELRERIIAVAGELGYAGPDPVARSLATRRGGAVAVLLGKGLSSAFSDPALSIVLDGLTSALDREDRALLLLPGINGGPSRESVARAHADVVIAYSLPDDAPAFEAVRDRRLPLVVIDQPEVPGAARVEAADRAGAMLAAELLVGLGHHHVGILSFAISPDGRSGPADDARIASARFRVTRDRLAGYRAGLGSAAPIWEAPESEREHGRIGAAWLLGRTPRPTALLCMSDELALGALRAARELGLDVPSQLSVIGFDDTPVARWAERPLTTIRQDLAAKGAMAGALAITLLDGARPPTPTMINVELVIRATTRPV